MKQFLYLLGLIFLPLAAIAQSGYVHDAMERKYGDPNAKKGTDWFNNHLMNAKYDEAYVFPLSLTMHITSYEENGGKKNESDIRYFINSAKNCFATNVGEDERRKKKKNDEMLIIYDYKANTMLMLNMTEKTGMAININAFMSGENIEKREKGGHPAAKTKSSMSCKRTGKTKTIQGYPCEEYICTDEDRNTRSEVWITTKIPMNIAQSGARGPMAAYWGSTSSLGGMMMEGHFYKDNQLESSIEVTDINPHADMKIKTTDFKMNGM